MTLAAGTKLGPYQIESAIGGGMGEVVYRATDTSLGAWVMIQANGWLTRELRASAHWPRLAKLMI